MHNQLLKAAALLSLALLAPAQTPLGSLTGVVADSSGSVMPDVRITVTDTERGRTFTGVRQDWTRNLDFSIFKQFRIRERYTAQFRAEAFNVMNTPVFGAPNTSVGSTGFATISTQSNPPRQIQLALKVIF